MAWLLCITGILFCLAGVYLFHKNAYEEKSSLQPAIAAMIIGVLLIAIGTAKYFHLVR